MNEPHVQQLAHLWGLVGTNLEVCVSLRIFRYVGMDIVSSTRYAKIQRNCIFAYLWMERIFNPNLDLTRSPYHLVLEGIAHPVVDQLQLVGHPAGEEVALALVLGQVLAVRLRRLAREVVEHSDAGALIYII